MGGMIAQELVLKFPKRVRSLTLVSTLAKPDNYTVAVLETLKAAKQNLTDELFYRTLGLRVFTHRFFNNPEAVRMWLDRALSNPYPQSVAGFIRQADAIVGHDTVSRLAEITVPTHVIFGDEDILTPPRYSHILAEGIRGRKLTTIAGVGHGVPAEAAEKFNRIALDFLVQH